MYVIEDLFDMRGVVGARIEQIMSDRNYSKSKFCKMCGISRPTMDKILSGSLGAKATYEKHIRKILNALGSTPDMLISNAENAYTQAREVRSTFHIAAEEISRVCGISPERLIKIEAGESATLAEWRDIALCLGTGTRCIDGSGFFFPQVSRSEVLLDVYYADRNRHTISGFWGHIGVQPVNSPDYLWFPITAHSKNLACDDLQKERMVVPCMNNKLLYLNPNNINNIVLLAEDCDKPGFANWDPSVSTREIPAVVYETLDDYFLYTETNKTPPNEIISPLLFQYIKHLSETEKWTKENVRDITDGIVVHYSDGTLMEHSIDLSQENEIVDDIQFIYAFGKPGCDKTFSSFSDFDEVITYINTDKISLIELPLAQTENVICKTLEEMRGERNEAEK